MSTIENHYSANKGRRFLLLLFFSLQKRKVGSPAGQAASLQNSLMNTIERDIDKMNKRKLDSHQTGTWDMRLISRDNTAIFL
jgi:hypothetical protein